MFHEFKLLKSKGYEFGFVNALKPST